MTRYELGLLLVLIAGLVGTGIGVVYLSYAGRMAFVELQDLRRERQDLEVRWEQLRIEEATLTNHSRIEAKARELLGMRLPHAGDVRVITGGAEHWRIK